MNKWKFTDDEIKSLLEELVHSDGVKKYILIREDAHEKYMSWIDLGRLDSIPDTELKARFLEYFNEGAGRHGFDARHRDKIIKNIESFRHALKFLLDESIPIEERLDECLNKGREHVRGFGEAIATSILMDSNLNEYST